MISNLKTKDEKTSQLKKSISDLTKMLSEKERDIAILQTKNNEITEKLLNTLLAKEDIQTQMQADLQETSQKYIKQIENLKELISEKEKQISCLREDNQVIQEQNDQQVSELKRL